MYKLIAALLALTLLAPHCAASADVGSFKVGYGEAPIKADLTAGTHYVAGYRNGQRATGILDDQYAKAVYIEDANGSAVILISIDCVALSRADTIRIRERLSDLDTPVHVISTHDHAGSDTLGLWGEVGCEGKNAAFIEELREAAEKAARAACADSTEGDMYFGYTDTKEMRIQEDTRLPNVYDSNLYSFRFVPRDASKPVTRLINYASHAESLDGDNSLISADFPAYVASYLAESEGSRMIWFPGAIGGLLRTRFTDPDRVANCKSTGRRIGEAVLTIDNERKLDSTLEIKTKEFSTECENPVFILMCTLGILEQKTHSALGRVYIDTEMTLMRIGGIPILMIPGELFPELAYGDGTGFKNAQPEKSLEPLTSLFGEDLLIFGLADDEIGYIVSPDNFLLNEEHPYIDRIRDKNGEDHYEETNSAGPGTAQAIYDAAAALAGSDK